MSLLTSLIGLLAIVEVYFATLKGQLGMNAGIGFLVAAPFVGAWAHHELTRKDQGLADYNVSARREVILGYECLIIGTANALAGPHVHALVATIGAAVLIGGQSLIWWLVFKNPHILRPIEPPRSAKNLSVRFIIFGFFYLGLVILACAIFIPRSTRAMVHSIPTEFQWPGIALLYATLGCLTLGIASEHSRGSVSFYIAVMVVAASSAGMELLERGNWYFLALSLFAFFCLVPAWPRAHERGPAGPALDRATEQSSG